MLPWHNAWQHGLGIATSVVPQETLRSGHAQPRSRLRSFARSWSIASRKCLQVSRVLMILKTNSSLLFLERFAGAFPHFVHSLRLGSGQASPGSGRTVKAAVPRPTPVRAEPFVKLRTGLSKHENPCGWVNP